MREDAVDKVRVDQVGLNHFFDYKNWQNVFYTLIHYEIPNENWKEIKHVISRMFYNLNLFKKIVKISQISLKYIYTLMLI